MDIKLCEWCGCEFGRKPDTRNNRWQAQRFCGQRCSAQWTAANREIHHLNGNYRYRDGMADSGLPEPLDFEPGSELKILALIIRAERRQELFHPEEPRYEVCHVRLHVASGHRGRRRIDDE